MKKIIFLDIDGVLTGPREWQIKKKPEYLDSYPFNKKAVKVLNSILNESGAKIVLSSDWRRHYSLSELKIIFDMNCVIKSPIAVTEILPAINKGYGGYGFFSTYQETRTREINLFLTNNPQIEKWVAIDDLELSVDNFVYCLFPDEGIRQTGIKEKILSYLI